MANLNEQVISTAGDIGVQLNIIADDSSDDDDIQQAVNNIRNKLDALVALAAAPAKPAADPAAASDPAAAQQTQAPSA